MLTPERSAGFPRFNQRGSQVFVVLRLYQPSSSPVFNNLVDARAVRSDYTSP